MAGIIPLCRLWSGFILFIKDNIELIANCATGIIANCGKAFGKRLREKSKAED